MWKPGDQILELGTTGKHQFTVSFETHLLVAEARYKGAKKVLDETRKHLLEAMNQAGVDKIDSEAMGVTIRPSCYREKFDTTKFRTDNPAMYDNYVSMAEVAATVAIKVH